MVLMKGLKQAGEELTREKFIAAIFLASAFKKTGRDMVSAKSNVAVILYLGGTHSFFIC